VRHRPCATSSAWGIAGSHGSPAPDEWIEATARDDGAAAELVEAGLEPGPRWAADWTAAAAAALAPEIAAAVRAADGPTAIAVANDQMALGLMAGLQAAGLRVPDDVSVTGFDDNPDAAFYTPALTTVRLDLMGEARRGIGAVLAAGEQVPPRAPTLVVRDSTARPRG
jgi:DNA-binding LacI/PurR family transcriptional regulator